MTENTRNIEWTLSFGVPVDEHLESSAISADRSKVRAQTTQTEDVPGLTTTSAEESEVSRQTAQAEEYPGLPEEEAPALMFAELGERNEIIDLRAYFQRSMFCIRSHTAGRFPDERIIMEGAADEMEGKITAALDEYLRVLDLAEVNFDAVFEDIMAPSK